MEGQVDPAAVEAGIVHAEDKSPDVGSDLKSTDESTPLAKAPKDPWYMYFMRWYMCEFFGHRYHVSEALCGIAVAVSILLSVIVLASGVPVYVLSIFMAAAALIALAFVWGIARLLSLAALATKLEKVHKRMKAAVDTYEAVNGTLAEEADVYTQHLGSFGIVTDDLQKSAEQAGELIGKLGDMQQNYQRLNQIQRELNENEAKYAAEKELINKDKDKELVKSEFRVMFDTFRRYPGRPGVAIADAFSIDKIRKFYAKYGQKSDIPPLSLTPELERELHEKFLHLQLFLTSMDIQLQTRFYELKFCGEKRKQLEVEVDAERQEFEALKKEHDAKIEAILKEIKK